MKYNSYGTGKQMVANFSRIAADKDAHAFLIVVGHAATLPAADEYRQLSIAGYQDAAAEFKPNLRAPAR